MLKTLKIARKLPKASEMAKTSKFCSSHPAWWFCRLSAVAAAATAAAPLRPRACGRGCGYVRIARQVYEGAINLNFRFKSKFQKIRIATVMPDAALMMPVPEKLGICKKIK